jgi:hypothetical protein
MPASSPFRGTRYQHLVRVVFLLRRCGGTPGPAAPDGALSEMRSQLRLQALDFWLRNPDYLANELLDEYEDGRRGRDALDQVRRILDDREPQVRRLPMTKYRFGAYEELDDVLAPLVTYSMVVHRPSVGSVKVTEHDYWFMPPGEEFAQELLHAALEIFEWYDERAALIMTVAGDTPGGALKQRQYQQLEYSTAAAKSLIEPITDRVIARLADLELEAA